MIWIRYLTCILLFVLLAANAIAEESDPLGSGSDAAASQDIRDTMGEDLFKPVQDTKGSATPVITGKSVPDTLGSAQPKARLLSPTSKWHLDLQDDKNQVVDLEMYQSNDAVFGRGIITAGNMVQNITATGTVSGNKLSLDILTFDLSLYRLSLTMNGKSLSGDYHSYSVSFVPVKGIAMGKIN